LYKVHPEGHEKDGKRQGFVSNSLPFGTLSKMVTICLNLASLSPNLSRLHISHY